MSTTFIEAYTAHIQVKGGPEWRLEDVRSIPSDATFKTVPGLVVSQKATIVARYYESNGQRYRTLKTPVVITEVQTDRTTCLAQ